MNTLIKLLFKMPTHCTVCSSLWTDNSFWRQLQKAQTKAAEIKNRGTSLRTAHIVWGEIEHGKVIEGILGP